MLFRRSRRTLPGTGRSVHLFQPDTLLQKGKQDFEVLCYLWLGLVHWIPLVEHDWVLSLFQEDDQSTSCMLLEENIIDGERGKLILSFPSSEETQIYYQVNSFPEAVVMNGKLLIEWIKSTSILDFDF